MIVFNIVVWSIVSTVWAALAWWKSHLDNVRIWPDVLASAGAAAVVHYVPGGVVGIVKHPVELAAQFIRRADYVLANDMLRDEYGVECGNPAQIGYCSFGPEDIIGKALERTAVLFGCLTHTEGDIYLTIVGEKEAIDKLEEVRLVALSDEYGYKNALNKALSEADIAGIGKERFDKWQEDYVEGLLVTSIWAQLVRIHMFLASLTVLTARGVT